MVVQFKLNPAAIHAAQALIGKAAGRVRAHEASIGLHEEDGGKPKRDYHYIDGVETLAQTMMEHEFGTAMLPERSFLRAWFDQHKSRLAEGMRKAMQGELTGNASSVIDWVRAVHAEWKAWIATGPFAQLSPITVAAKSKAGLAEPDVALMATYQFREAWRAKLDGSFT